MRLAPLLLAVAALAAAAVATAASAEADDPPTAEIYCQGAQVVGVRIEVRRTGMLTLRIPPNVCAPAKPQQHQGPPPAPSSRWAT